VCDVCGRDGLVLIYYLIYVFFYFFLVKAAREKEEKDKESFGIRIKRSVINQIVLGGICQIYRIGYIEGALHSPPIDIL